MAPPEYVEVAETFQTLEGRPAGLVDIQIKAIGSGTDLPDGVHFELFPVHGGSPLMRYTNAGCWPVRAV
jgi:hypothetical protein